jgi:hypothetical protein
MMSTILVAGFDSCAFGPLELFFIGKLLEVLAPAPKSKSKFAAAPPWFADEKKSSSAGL